MTQCNHLEHADLFTVLIESGFRTAEGMYLPWHDVDLKQRVMRVWSKDTRTAQDRRVAITDAAMEVLTRRYAERGMNQRVFPNVTKSNMRSVWANVRKALGADDPAFIWYVTRHTCATRLIQANVDIKTVQTILGHARVETTMRYIQFHAGSLAVAADALSEARRVSRALPPCHKPSDTPALEDK